MVASVLDESTEKEKSEALKYYSELDNETVEQKKTPLKVKKR